MIDEERNVHKIKIRHIIVTTSLGRYIDTYIIDRYPFTVFVPTEFDDKSLFRFHMLGRQYILISDPDFLKFGKYFRFR